MLQRRMPGRLMGSVPLMGGGQSYIQKVLGIQLSDMILYHPMNEPSGGVAVDYSPEGNNGAYTGVTLGQPGIGDGETCPLFDGVNDFNNIYSAGLNTDFDGGEGTIVIWGKMSAAGVWTDGVERGFLRVRVDGNNTVRVTKDIANNQITWKYAAGGIIETISKGSVSTLDWFNIGMTWSATDDEVKFFYNGVQEGATQTILGVWVGNLNVSRCCFGAISTVPALPFDGYEAHGIIWKIALTPSEMADVGTR